MKRQVHLTEGTTAQHPSHFVVEKGGCITKGHIRRLGHLLALEVDFDVSFNVPYVFGVGGLLADLDFVVL